MTKVVQGVLQTFYKFFKITSLPHSISSPSIKTLTTSATATPVVKPISTAASAGASHASTSPAISNI